MDDNTEIGSGAILSNDETIHALRQGVDVSYRTEFLTIEDSFGKEHSVPVSLTETEDGFSVGLMHDVIHHVATRAAGPVRRSGTVACGSLDSLIEYVNRYKGSDAVAFAPLEPPSVSVIFNYHPAGAARSSVAAWADDVAEFSCPVSRQWRLWAGIEGCPLVQSRFGDLIEQNADDLRGDEDTGLASAARMLEVARNLVIHSAGKFERKINPTTGEGTLIVSDDHAANSTKIPKAFGLAIPVFEGSTDLYPVECRLRFSMPEGRPQFSFTLHNRHQVFEHALAEMRKAVATRCGIPVFVGSAP